jgi:endonuclease G
MIAFLLPNEKSTKPLRTYVVSVDSVESLTGIDFFSELADTIESVLESKKDVSAWFDNMH